MAVVVNYLVGGARASWGMSDGNDGVPTENVGSLEVGGIRFGQSESAGSYCDFLWFREITIPAGGSYRVDLLSATEKDRFGRLILFSKVTYLQIEHLATSASEGLVSFGGTAEVFPVALPGLARSGLFVLALPGGAALPVVDITSECFVLVNSDVSHAASVRVCVGGVGGGVESHVESETFGPEIP